jgi:ABC-type phosphate/phosphonate transport system substrate-binding protein
MFRRQAIHVRLTLIGTFLATFVASAHGAEPAKQVEPVRIGLARSLCRDTPEALVQVIMEPFGSLMESQTGVAGQLVIAGQAHDLALQMKAGKFQLGVFQGVEFAWAQQECPELKPLMIAINKRRQLQAYIVVRNDSTAAAFDDLRQKTVALPRRSREHCHLFLERCCRERGQDAAHYFSQIVTPPGVESALDDVLRGKVQAALVDAVGLESYKREKPGCFERLKTIKISEVFPAAVVAYYPGRLSDGTLNRFKQGMARSNETAVGRQILAAVRWTGFEPVPADYGKTQADILKAYPPPVPGERKASLQTRATSLSAGATH